MFIYHLPPACSTDDLADSCLQFTPSSKIRVPCHRWLALQHKECFGWLRNKHRKRKAKQSVDLSSAGAEHGEDKWSQCSAEFLWCPVSVAGLRRWRYGGAGLCWESVLWVSWTLEPSVLPCYAKHTDPHSFLQPGLEQGPFPDLPRVHGDATGHTCEAVHGLFLMLNL